MRVTTKNLLSFFPGDRWTERLTPEQASEIRQVIAAANVSGARHDVHAMAALNKACAIMNGHGVEGMYSRTTREEAYYINTGDTYSTTILYDFNKRRFSITSWGDWYESTKCFQRDIDDMA